MVRPVLNNPLKIQHLLVIISSSYALSIVTLILLLEVTALLVANKCSYY